MQDLSNENVVHIKDGDIEYLQFKKLLEYKDRVTHCYTTRSDNYEKDDGKNYKRLYESLNLDYKKCVKIKEQIHSNFVQIIENKGTKPDKVDGLITNKKGISFSLRFADCTPIYLYDPVENVIGDIHSGWKGTANKIACVAVKKMIEEYNSKPEDIICCIGPTIGKCHFEVDEDVKNIFETTFSYMNINDRIIEKGEVKEGKQKYFIDTNLINRTMLEEIGLLKENIIESNICTVCNKDVLHSYRVDRQNAGRNTAIISLK